MYTARFKATSLSLTTWRAWKLKRRSIRSGGLSARIQLISSSRPTVGQQSVPVWVASVSQSSFLLSDKTIKLWKVSERDKRAEGYNLKEDTGIIRDPSSINCLKVSFDVVVVVVFILVQHPILQSAWGFLQTHARSLSSSRSNRDREKLWHLYWTRRLAQTVWKLDKGQTHFSNFFFLELPSQSALACHYERQHHIRRGSRKVVPYFLDFPAWPPPPPASVVSVRHAQRGQVHRYIQKWKRSAVCCCCFGCRCWWLCMAK